MRSWWREPLLHFLLLGALLFVFDRILTTADESSRQITVGPDLKRELSATFEEGRGHAPNAEELAQLVEAWLKNELLYREGLALGLDRGDPMIRERVIHKMRLLVMNSVVVDSPSEAQLREWFASHRAAYSQPKRFDFAQVYVKGDGPAGRLEAERLMVAINNGTEPRNIGQFARGYRRRPRENIVFMFGEAFAAELEKQPLREWRVLRSDKAWHVVRLDAIHDERPAHFESLRQRIEGDWRQQRQRQLALDALQQIRQAYDIREESGA